MTDPVTVAREVVDDYERMDDWNKPRTRSGKEVPPSRVTLARAVLRVEELADRLDDGHLRHLIRTTLNGETDG